MSELKRSPPFRAEHLGSLLRPESLLQNRQDVLDGKMSEQELERREDEAIKMAVDMQRSTGLRPISDGEYRRLIFYGTFLTSLRGMKVIQDPPLSLFRTYNPSIAAYVESGVKPGPIVVCDARLSHPGHSDNVKQLKYLQSILPEKKWRDIKITLIAPEWFHFRLAEGSAYSKDVYQNDEEHFEDLAKAYQVELDMLYQAGLRNVQIDDPTLAYFCSTPFREGWKNDTNNTKTTEQMLDAYIGLHNAAFSKRPADMHLGIHLCRGNFAKSKHFSSGGYDVIASQLFQKLNVDTFYLEYDTPRAGGFAPLTHLPRNKNVILGVITSKFPALEDKEEVKRRIYEAADHVARGKGESREEALRRLGVSPQCGFASHAEGNALGWEDMVRKLRLVRTVADEVWPGED